MKYVLMWLALAVATLLLFSQINWITYLRLVRYGERTEGTVIQVTPRTHATVLYEYQIKGQKVQGQTQPAPPNPPLENLTSGQKLIVYYDPQEPTRSVIADPITLLRNETVAMLMVSFVMATAIVLTWRYRILSASSKMFRRTNGTEE